MSESDVINVNVIPALYAIAETLESSISQR